MPYATFIIAALFVSAVAGTVSLSDFFQVEVKAETKDADPISNPLTLITIPNETQIEFGIGVYNEDLEPVNDFQVGLEVDLMLELKWLRAGTYPVIANTTTIIISDETGNVTLTKVIGPLGGGWSASTCGGQTDVVRWVPEVEGNYSAGVKFEGLIYEAPEDYGNAIPFRVHKPGSFIGKVTEVDETTAINNTLVEALVNGLVQANTTTDDEGLFNLELTRGGVYDVRVSAPGYISIIQSGVSTEITSLCLNFSLAPMALSPSFNILWRANAGNSRNAVIDSYGNIIVASESEMGFTVVSKFDSNGNLLWNISRTFSGAWEVPKGVAVDSLDNILLLVAPNQIWCYDLWTVKLDPDGNHVWMKSFDSGETDQGTSIAVDSFDNVIVIGSVHGNLTSTLVKYNSNGGLIWSKTLPIYFETGEIVIDNDNNIILGGITASDSTGVDYYVSKLDNSGSLLWEKTFNSENGQYDYGYGVSLDSNENIIVIGNRFTVKLGPDGSEIWLKNFSGKDLVVDLYDNIFSIRESFVEMFDRDGYFLGNIDLTEELSILAIDQNSTLIVGGTRNLVKMGLGGNSTTQSDDPIPQPKTSPESDQNIPSSKATFASISLEPSVVEVNQTVRINMVVDPSPPTSTDVFEGLVLTITSPNGHIYVKGPYFTNPNGSQHGFFTPVQSGNYTFQLHYSGQFFTSKEIEYAAADSPILTLTVNPPPETSTQLSTQTPALSPMTSPAPSPVPSQEASPIPDPQQTDQPRINSALAIIASLSAVSTVFPIYFKKRKH